MRHFIYAFNAAGASDYTNEITIAPGTMPEAPAVSAPPPAQGPKQELSVAFYGANIGDPDTDPGQGNIWLAYTTETEMGGTIRSNHKPYPEDPTITSLQSVLFDLLPKIDADHNNQLSAQEIDAVQVDIVGYSLGAVAAVNLSRLLNEQGLQVSAGPNYDAGYWLAEPIPVHRLELIDGVHIGAGPIGPFAEAIRPVSGKIELNVEVSNQYFQERGGETAIDLYYPGSTNNGQDINPFFYLGSDPYGSAFSSALIGTTFASKGTRNIHNVTSDPDFANWPPLDVSYTTELLPDGAGTYQFTDNYDGILFGNQVQHDSMPWYLRGDIHADIFAP